jgi:hypothetical protein
MFCSTEVFGTVRFKAKHSNSFPVRTKYIIKMVTTLFVENLTVDNLPKEYFTSIIDFLGNFQFFVDHKSKIDRKYFQRRFGESNFWQRNYTGGRMLVLTDAQLRVHIFGLCQLVLLAGAHLICDEYGLKVAQLRVHAKMCTRTYPPSPVLETPSRITQYVLVPSTYSYPFSYPNLSKFLFQQSTPVYVLMTLGRFQFKSAFGGVPFGFLLSPTFGAK